MAQCIQCGSAADYDFRVLEVQTLHIRDISGERRVQALGRFQDFSVCRGCAEARLQQAARPAWPLVKKLLPFGLILILGGAMAILCRSEVPALWVCGLAGVVCGALGLFTGVRSWLSTRREYAALSPEKALQRAAWDCLLASAPKKDGENDLTYIPVNEETLARKNGDLMILYDLLPAVAQKAWNILHGADEEN